ncbi:hypothetical protein [Flexithrix dorotheae]|uniref:hypothetical protein n=1 Tax=Flexithrix dorotheae TaxID=70993 RepID=UPI0003615BB6|nr:hypothetical protein [Flexithrix dorotheae]
MKVIQFDPNLKAISFLVASIQRLYAKNIKKPTTKTDDYDEGVGVLNAHFNTSKEPVPLTKP